MERLTIDQLLAGVARLEPALPPASEVQAPRGGSFQDHLERARLSTADSRPLEQRQDNSASSSERDGASSSSSSDTPRRADTTSAADNANGADDGRSEPTESAAPDNESQATDTAADANAVTTSTEAAAAAPIAAAQAIAANVSAAVDEAATESVAGDSKQGQRADKSKAIPLVAADQPAPHALAAAGATPSSLAPEVVSQTNETAATSLLPEAEISPKEGVPQAAPDSELPVAAKLQPGDEQHRSLAAIEHASPAAPADTPSNLPLEPQAPLANNDDGTQERSRKERPPASDQAGKVEPPANDVVATSQIAPEVAAVLEPTSNATPPAERHGAEAKQQPDVLPVQDSIAPTSARLESDTSLAVPRSLAIQLGQRTAAQKSPAGAHTASEADQARLVQRVVRAFQSLADGGGQVRLRLSPPELGALRLEITVREGVLAAQVEAETPQARTLLLESLPGLRERLAEQNIKIERFEVDLMNQPQGGLPNPFAGDGEQGDREARSDSNIRGTSPQSAEAAVQAPARRHGEWSELNVVV